MNDADWVVGQKVAVIGRHFGVDIEMHTITKVLKRFVVLSDDSRWNLSGRPYPRQPYPRQWIEPLTEAHKAKVLRQKLISKLEAVRGRDAWGSVDTVVLKAMVEQLGDKSST